MPQVLFYFRDILLDILMRCVYNEDKERHALHYFVKGDILWQARKSQKLSR